MRFFSTLILLCITFSAFAQVGINTDTPHPSAMLEVNSDSKGFLFPRVALQSTTDTSTISDPAEGLMIYNTGTDNLSFFPGIHFFDGTVWKSIQQAPEPGNTAVANIVRDAAPGYGGFSGNTPPSGMTVTNLNGFVTTGFGGSISNIFNGNLALSGNSTMHFQRSNSTDDWGHSFEFDKRIRFTQVDVNGRTDGGAGVVNRIGNVVIQVLLLGDVQWTSSPIATPASANSNIVTIPNVVGNEIRVIIPNGGNNGDSSGGATNLINYDELIISGEL